MSEDVRPVSDEKVRKIRATFDHGESAGYAHQATLDLLADRDWANAQIRHLRRDLYHEETYTNVPGDHCDPRCSCWASPAAIRQEF